VFQTGIGTAYGRRLLPATETVAGINDLVRRALRWYPHLSEDKVRVVLIHSGPVIIPELEESLGVYA
jgi:NADH dehydrogenase